MTSYGCSMEGAPPKKGNGINCTGASTILKPLGGLQPYETWTFRICSESVFGAFPEFIQILLGILQKGSPERCRFRSLPFFFFHFLRFFFCPSPFFTPFWLFFFLGSVFFRFFPFSSVSFLEKKKTGRHPSRDPFCETPICSGNV